MTQPLTCITATTIAATLLFTATTAQALDIMVVNDEAPGGRQRQ